MWHLKFHTANYQVLTSLDTGNQITLSGNEIYLDVFGAEESILLTKGESARADFQSISDGLGPVF